MFEKKVKQKHLVPSDMPAAVHAILYQLRRKILLIRFAGIAPS